MDKHVANLINLVLSFTFTISVVFAILEKKYNLAVFIGIFTLISLFINILALTNRQKEIKRKTIGFKMENRGFNKGKFV